jgi:hypothetical protein
MVAIGDLARGGGVTLHRAPVRAGRGEPQTAAESGPATERILTVDDLVSGGPPTGRWAAQDDSLAVLTRIDPGDVIVPSVLAAQGTVVRVAGDAERGALLGPNLHLLRPDPQVLDPWFLAGFLSAPANTRQATYGSSVVRLDVRRFEIPLLPLDVQRRYGSAFRSLHAYRELMARAQSLGDTLAQGLLDGFTAGVLEP